MRYKTIGMHVTAATETVVFTVPPNHEARLEYIHATNHTGNNKTLNIMWQRDGDHTHIVDDYLVDSGNFLDIMTNNAFIIMDENDSLRVETQTGSQFDIIATYAVYPVMTQGG
jgi:hypothetical protein